MNLIEFVEDFYRQGDEAIPRLMDGKTPTCRKGCDACCYQLIGTFPMEAINIFAGLVHLGERRLREVVTRCFWYARDLFSFPDPFNCFKLHIPCVFLRNHQCEIYPNRPITCRYYFALSDPRDCGGEAGKEVRLLDAHIQAGKNMGAVAQEFVANNPEERIPLMGPLPAMLVWAMAATYTGGGKRWAEKRLHRLPPVETWAERMRRGQE